MTIRRRLQRLEQRPDTSVNRTFDDVVDLWGRVSAWLAENGFPDALAALEAGVEIPVDLEAEIRERARFDRRHREFARIEAVLAGEGSTTDIDWKAFQDTPEAA